MRTQLATLKLGFKVNEQRLKDVVLREPTVADYIAAEVNAPVYRQYAFKVALISRLIEKLEGFDGEVTMGMMKELKPVDVARLSDALRLVCDNAQGGQLSVSAELLADLFGEEFLAAVPAPRNEESKECHERNRHSAGPSNDFGRSEPHHHPQSAA